MALLWATVKIRPSQTKRVNPSRMDAPSINGVFAGYGVELGCGGAGVYQAWSLEEFASLDMSIGGCHLTRFQDHPHLVKTMQRPEEGLGCPLNDAYDCINHTLEGLHIPISFPS